MQNNLYRSTCPSPKNNQFYASKISLHNELIEGNNLDGLFFFFQKLFSIWNTN